MMKEKSLNSSEVGDLVCANKKAREVSPEAQKARRVSGPNIAEFQVSGGGGS